MLWYGNLKTYFLMTLLEPNKTKAIAIMSQNCDRN